jgi:hypothetical protein
MYDDDNAMRVMYKGSEVVGNLDGKKERIQLYDPIINTECDRSGSGHDKSYVQAQ